MNVDRAQGGIVRPGVMDQLGERRKQERFGLRCRVLFLRESWDELGDGLTQNISSGGLYCLSPIPLTTGQSLICLLRMPSHDSANDESFALQCRIRVVRVEKPNEDGSFGIGCKIEDYHPTLHEPPLLSN